MERFAVDPVCAGAVGRECDEVSKRTATAHSEVTPIAKCLKARAGELCVVVDEDRSTAALVVHAHQQPIADVDVMRFVVRGDLHTWIADMLGRRARSWRREEECSDDT
jgi:hypothetical protein